MYEEIKAHCRQLRMTNLSDEVGDGVGKVAEEKLDVSNGH